MIDPAMFLPLATGQTELLIKAVERLSQRSAELPQPFSRAGPVILRAAPAIFETVPDVRRGNCELSQNCWPVLDCLDSSEFGN